MAGYGIYAKSDFGNIGNNNKSMNLKIYTYILCIHTKIHESWSISQGDTKKKYVKINIWPYDKKIGK